MIKNLTATLITVLFGFLIALAQDKKPCSLNNPSSCTREELARMQAELRRQEPCRLEVRYDRFKDETLDGCMYAFRSNLYAPKDELSLHLMAQYSGKEPSGTIRFYFWLNRFYPQASASSSFLFGDASDLFLIIDDKRISLRISNYKPTPPEDDFLKLLTEHAEADIDAKTLLALSTAHSVEARWGPKELSVSSIAIERMQDFLRRYNKATPR